VYPLVTSATGTKFGKTEAGTVWLDPERTSPYRFYQYWLNTDDQDALRYLRYFTLLSRAEVGDLEDQLRERPHERAAQRSLAEAVTRSVHGETGLAQARQATQVLFGGTLEGLGEAELADIFADVPSSELPRTDLEGQGVQIVDLLAESGVASSKGDARRSMQGGGIYLNNVRVDDVERTATHADLLAGRFLLLRKGKKSYHLIKVRG
jgi:tyrosyl-tRNA synthetase